MLATRDLSSTGAGRSHGLLTRLVLNTRPAPTSTARVRSCRYSPRAPRCSVQGAPQPLPVTDNWLGSLFLRLLPGYLYFAPSFIMPLVTAAAAIGAIYGPALLAATATLPVIRTIPPLAGILTVLGTCQPWSGLASVFLSLLTAWYAFGVIPVLDWVLGRDRRNPAPSEVEAASSDALYRGILYAYVPVHWGMLALVCHLSCRSALSAGAFAGVAISCGVANGILFTVAHELLHGSRRLDKVLANVLLAVVGYNHWSKSHLQHHIKVGTPEDPSTARLGETLWHFIPRSVWGNLVDGYGAEAARRERNGVPFWSTHNRALWWALSPVAVAALATAAYGPSGLAFFLMQATVGILMLELVNYVEHYGLQRAKRPSGSYERVDPRHSWNATQLYTNAVAFKLQRHSDHHAHSSTPYHLLKDVSLAPQLPAGYPAMMLLATVPPLFFRVMDPLLDRESKKVAA